MKEQFPHGILWGGRKIVPALSRAFFHAKNGEKTTDTR